MDLIYTNANRVDQGVLLDYELDLAFGADENNFESGTKGPKGRNPCNHVHFSPISQRYFK